MTHVTHMRTLTLDLCLRLKELADACGFPKAAADDLCLRSATLPATIRPVEFSDPQKPGHEPVALMLFRDGCGTTIIDGPKNRKWAGIISWAKALNVSSVVLRGGRSSSHVLLGALMLTEANIPYRVQCTSHHRGHGSVVSPTEALLRLLVKEDHFASQDWTPPQQACILPEGGLHAASLVGLLSLSLLVDATLRQNPGSWNVVIDSGSGTTALGLLNGLARLDTARQVESLRVHIVHVAGGKSGFNEAHRQASVLMDLATSAWPSCVHHTPPAGRAFGSVNRTVRTACAHFTREAGVFFDPVYTAKTALVAREIAQDRCGERTLLIHTGGTLNLCGFLPLEPAPAARAPSHIEGHTAL